jgi:hypothetical protein
MPMQPHRRQASRAGLALIAVLTLVAGCDREAPPAPPPAAAVATPAPPPPPKPTYTLIITWMYAAQPPQTTQAVFHDEAACDQARDAEIAEGRRLALEAIGDTSPAAERPAAPAVTRRYIGSALLPSDVTTPPPASAPQSAPPKVAAICAATSAP